MRDGVVVVCLFAVLIATSQADSRRHHDTCLHQLHHNQRDSGEGATSCSPLEDYFKCEMQSQGTVDLEEVLSHFDYEFYLNCDVTTLWKIFDEETEYIFTPCIESFHQQEMEWDTRSTSRQGDNRVCNALHQLTHCFLFAYQSSGSNRRAAGRMEHALQKQTDAYLRMFGIHCNSNIGDLEQKQGEYKSNLGLVFGLVAAGCVLLTGLVIAAVLCRRNSADRRQTQTARRLNRQENLNDASLHTSALPPGIVYKPPDYPGPPPYTSDPPLYEDVVQQ